MTHAKVEVLITIRLQSGVKKSFWIDPFGAPQKSAGSENSTSGTSGKKSAGSYFGPKTNKLPAKPPEFPEAVPAIPAALPKDEVYWSGLGAFGGTGKIQPETLIRELYEVRSELASERHSLADELAPIWAERDYLKGQIMATYGRRPFAFGDRPGRVPLWAGLLEISATWGKRFAAYTEIGTRIRHITRQIKTEELRWKRLRDRHGRQARQPT